MQLYARATELDPQSVRAWLRKADLQAARTGGSGTDKHARSALHAYKTVTQREPGSVLGWLGQARIHEAALRPELALDAYARVSKLDPRNDEAWLRQASILESEGQREKADEVRRKAWAEGVLIPEPPRTIRGRLWQGLREVSYDPRESLEKLWEKVLGLIGLVFFGIPFVAFFVPALAIAFVVKLALRPVGQTRAHDLGGYLDRQTGRLFDRKEWLIYLWVIPVGLAWPAVAVVAIVAHHAPAFANGRQLKGFFFFFASAPLMVIFACVAAGYITKEPIGAAAAYVVLGLVAPVLAMLYLTSAL